MIQHTHGSCDWAPTLCGLRLCYALTGCADGWRCSSCVLARSHKGWRGRYSRGSIQPLVSSVLLDLVLAVTILAAPFGIVSDRISR